MRTRSQDMLCLRNRHENIDAASVGPAVVKISRKKHQCAATCVSEIPFLLERPKAQSVPLDHHCTYITRDADQAHCCHWFVCSSQSENLQPGRPCNLRLHANETDLSFASPIKPI
jgi:hypothetical protein